MFERSMKMKAEKVFNGVLGATVALMMLSSCASVKPCVEADTEEQQFFQSKKFKEAVAQRDSLCDRTNALEKELTATNEELSKTQKNLSESKAKGKELENELAEQKKAYDELKLSSGAKVAGLSSDLAAKQKELADKEQLLKNREERLKMLEEIVKKQDELMNALSDRVKKALMGFDSDELSVEMRDGKVYVSMSDKLLFKSGNEATEPKKKGAFKKIADLMKSNTYSDMAI